MKRSDGYAGGVTCPYFPNLTCSDSAVCPVKRLRTIIRSRIGMYLSYYTRHSKKIKSVEKGYSRQERCFWSGSEYRGVKVSNRARDVMWETCCWRNGTVKERWWKWCLKRDCLSEHFLKWSNWEISNGTFDAPLLPSLYQVRLISIAISFSRTLTLRTSNGGQKTTHDSMYVLYLYQSICSKSFRNLIYIGSIPDASSTGPKDEDTRTWVLMIILLYSRLRQMPRLLRSRYEQNLSSDSVLAFSLSALEKDPSSVSFMSISLALSLDTLRA